MRVQQFYIFYSYLFYSFLASKVKENVKLLITTRLDMENEFIAGRKNICVLRGLKNKSQENF